MRTLLINELLELSPSEQEARIFEEAAILVAETSGNSHIGYDRECESAEEKLWFELCAHEMWVEKSNRTTRT